MINLIDLFSGAGGFSSGFTKTRTARAFLAVDNWKDALQVHKHHHKVCDHIVMNLGPSTEEKLLSAIGEAMERATVSSRSHVHLHASPPCQLITSMNALRDTTQGLKLTRWALRFATKILPDFLKKRGHTGKYTWTIEQVSHPKVMNLFRKARCFHSVVDMSRYGVPQTRSRLLASNFDLEGNMAVKEASPAADYINIPKGGKYLGNSCICPKRWAEQGINCHVRDLRTEPAFTITSHFHWLISAEHKLLRTLTTEENAALQTFPSQYFRCFTGTKSALARMIGNSIPPLFAQKVAIAVAKA